MGGVHILLLLGTLQGFQSQTIHVSQIPVIVTPEGSSVTLPCNYSISGAEDITIGSYRWYRHLVRTGPEVSDSNKDFTGRISREDFDEFIYNRSASITLHRVHVSDTGMYYCEVTFQHGGEISGHGTGTNLNVTGESLTPGLSFIKPNI
ncbi:natural cytotoxicity triggering receptor 3-like [Mixophyes fleayi]|uniref:natural cytotoxicity triggering receptor 3-like n=1 Tax=Mixophyes fleayi TaxID=3061075 RepID=UPI003F4DD7FB